MDVDALVGAGWSEHPEDPAGVAERLRAGVSLVEDGPGAAKYMNLVNHVVGDHLGRRDEAARLCEEAMHRAGAEPGPGPYVHLAVARTLAGDVDGAEAAVKVLGDHPAQRIRVGLLVAQCHGHAGAWDDAARIYDEQLTLGEDLPEGHDAERSFAIVSNNIASEVMNQDLRGATTDALLERAAYASGVYWRRVGTWVNDERADYLLALAHNHLGRHAEAADYADRGLATIAEADGEEPVDEAFLHLARARACRELGRADDQAASIAHAEKLAEGFEGPGLVDWFQGELAKAR